MRSAPKGLFVNEAGRVCVTSAGLVVQFGLSPDELRAFAAEVLAAADRIEAGVEALVDAAIARATWRQ